MSFDEQFNKLSSKDPSPEDMHAFVMPPGITPIAGQILAEPARRSRRNGKRKKKMKHERKNPADARKRHYPPSTAG